MSQRQTSFIIPLDLLASRVSCLFLIGGTNRSQRYLVPRPRRFSPLLSADRYGRNARRSIIIFSRKRVVVNARLSVARPRSLLTRSTPRKKHVSSNDGVRVRVFRFIGIFTRVNDSASLKRKLRERLGTIRSRFVPERYERSAAEIDSNRAQLPKNTARHLPSRSISRISRDESRARPYHANGIRGNG